MLQVVIEQRSVDSVVSYIERTKQRIFQKMREGMQEGMEGLAGEAVYQATAAGIHNKTGQLFTDMLNSPKVGENADVIWGRVSTKSDMTVKGRTFEGYLGTALDQGFTVPSAVPSGRKIDGAQGDAKVYQFAPADGESRFTFGHAAFKVAPHHFLRRAKEEFASPIMEIIERRVAEAYE
jgi:hypothetical protein